MNLFEEIFWVHFSSIIKFNDESNSSKSNDCCQAKENPIETEYIRAQDFSRGPEKFRCSWHLPESSVAAVSIEWENCTGFFNTCVRYLFQFSVHLFRSQNFHGVHTNLLHWITLYPHCFRIVDPDFQCAGIIQVDQQLWESHQYGWVLKSSFYFSELVFITQNNCQLWNTRRRDRLSMKRFDWKKIWVNIYSLSWWKWQHFLSLHCVSFTLSTCTFRPIWGVKRSH